MAKKVVPAKRMSIDELEGILQQDEDAPIEILPDGTVRATGRRRGKRKPLTLKQALGGEYGAVV